MLLELIAERGKDVLAALGVEQLDLAGEDIDILVGLTRLAATALVNPISIQGQIEGGVLMGMGYALTEDWPLKDCVPQARYGTLGLFRAPEIPDIHAIYVEKDELLPVAYGGKGIGEIATIPTAPAVQNAYRAFDGKLRPDLPMVDTPYSRARHRG